MLQQALTITYFLYNGQFYDKTDGVAMGSPLDPAMTNFHMEHSEQQALRAASLKPAHWYRYVDDTFMVRMIC
jgi:hypothetical protein